MSVCTVYVTVPSREAAMAIGRAAVEARLAAGANVVPGVASIYRWQGAIEEADEVIVLLKTRRELVAPLTEKIVALHSYDCPCVVALPIEAGHAPYLDWIRDETGP